MAAGGSARPSWRTSGPRAGRRLTAGYARTAVKVRVTGASGFIGRAACAELNERGHDVVALVRRPGSEPPGTTPVHGDLRDAESLDKAIAEAKPDAVAHLAAEIGSQRNAKKIEAVNIEGMQCLIDACKAAGSPRVVFVSTAVTGDPLTMYDFVALTADALGVGKPRRVPVAVARLAAGAGPVAATVRSARTSNARIKRELGWSPRFATAREGVPDAVAKLSDA